MMRTVAVRFLDFTAKLLLILQAGPYLREEVAC